MTIPTELDGMEVIQYAEFPPPSEPSAFELSQQGRMLQPGRYAVICRRPSQRGFHTLVYTADWLVISSAVSESMAEATCVPPGLEHTNLEWRFWEYKLASKLKLAQKWVVYSVVSLLLCVAALVPSHWLGWYILSNVLIPLSMTISLLVLLVGSARIWWLLVRLAVTGGGPLYGGTHLLLAIFVTPQFLVGLFAVPALVLGDIRRWREWDETR
ncbi:MAG: hypothetical protein U1E05_17005, partial [Patescibacteria group bacterium]|nr:hypothetical protein [Patescibacteria group bacterium]